MAEQRPNVEVVPFAPRYAAAFATLNRQWIETYFKVEEEDLKIMNHPQAYVLDGGGEIFTALVDGEPVGTVAMVRINASTFELAKMAVSPERQGLGISHRLMKSCVDFAAAQGAKEIFLITNDILKPAMALYEKSGFVRQPKNNDLRYARGNTEMRMTLI